MVGALAALALAAVRRARACAPWRLPRCSRRCCSRPATWAVDTLGHATSGTFPAGGPESASMPVDGGLGGGPEGAADSRAGSGRGGFGAGSAGRRCASERGAAGAAAGRWPGRRSACGCVLAAAQGPVGRARGGAAATPGVRAMAPQGYARLDRRAAWRRRRRSIGPGGSGGSLSKAMLSYVKQHGGGTIAVESQSSAAAAIIERGRRRSWDRRLLRSRERRERRLAGREVAPGKSAGCSRRPERQ